MSKQDTPGVGHNSGEVSSERIKSFISRIEKLNDDKSGIADDIKDVYAEIKSDGFDAKTIRRIIRDRKLDAQKRREQQELLDLYKSAIGMED
jgi:uncharacterized protein (UPF0335 family)